MFRDMLNFNGVNWWTLLGGLEMPFGVALDVAGQDIYWTDMATGKIQRTVMSGILPFFEDIVTGLDSPTAIAIITSGTSADFDEDGDVDSDDFDAWRTGFGTTGSASHGDGDADGEGDVDGGDFLVWQREFGKTTGSGSLSSSVPEPSSIVLLLTFTVLALARCRMRRRTTC